MGEILTVFKGAKGPLEWLLSGRGAVPHDLACSRAATCLGCDKNGSGPLTNWFTEPAADLIRQEIERRSEFKLETPYDAALGTCTVCFCVLPVKVFEPLDLAIAGLSEEQREELPSRCWIKSESPPPPEPQQGTNAEPTTPQT